MIRKWALNKTKIHVIDTEMGDSNDLAEILMLRNTETEDEKGSRIRITASPKTFVPSKPSTRKGNS